MTQQRKIAENPRNESTDTHVCVTDARCEHGEHEMAQELLDVSMMPLDEWISLIRNPPSGKVFVRNMFPTEHHKEEWLRTARDRPEADVKLLLRHFLVSTGHSPLDVVHAKFLVRQIRAGHVMSEGMREHDRRLIQFLMSKGKYPVWEGVGWVLDLLPHFPRKALDAIDAFLCVAYGSLSDSYLDGLFDAQSIIRNRYIEGAHTAERAVDALMALSWRELEFLCAVAYEHMGFEVVVTPEGNDDGVDVFAKSADLGKKGLVVIQAKKWAKSNPVGKREVRELLGTMDLHKATKGVLVTTGRYESGALKMGEEDPRLELLESNKVLLLLNEYCGTDWYVRVDRLLFSFRKSDFPSAVPGHTSSSSDQV